jgi:hypothetical protein
MADAQTILRAIGVGQAAFVEQAAGTCCGAISPTHDVG